MNDDHVDGRLTSIAAFERAKYAREEARNYLEGYLYRLSALLNKDAENRVLHDFATSAEKSAIGKLVQESLNWLSEHAEKADEKTLKGKRADLEWVLSIFLIPVLFVP